jgi:F0F1-type ATP synthase epsilon subunit
VSSFPLLSLRILSPDGLSIEKEDLTAVLVPLADGGWIGIKPGHTPLVAETVRGAIRFRTETDENQIEVHPGVLEIRENSVVVLTAGEVSQQAELLTPPAPIEFNRLMRTLSGDSLTFMDDGSTQNE